MPPCSYEANAWFACQDSKWDKALHEAQLWLVDQPFSSRPALLGSYIACSAVEKYDLAVAFAEQGLLSNPKDFILQNNLAFALASRGDIDEASRALRKIDVGGLDDGQRVVFDATVGLVLFRSGNLEAGRSCYRAAIRRGSRLNGPRGAVARIYYAFEELRAGSADAEALRKEALDGASHLAEPAYVAVVERLRCFKVAKP